MAAEANNVACFWHHCRRSIAHHTFGSFGAAKANCDRHCSRQRRQQVSSNGCNWCIQVVVIIVDSFQSCELNLFDCVLSHIPMDLPIGRYRIRHCHRPLFGIDRNASQSSASHE